LLVDRPCRTARRQKAKGEQAKALKATHEEVEEEGDEQKLQHTTRWTRERWVEDRNRRGTRQAEARRDGQVVLPVASIALRTVIVYVTMLCAVRILGKRTVGNLTAFDMLVALMLGDLAGPAIYGDAPMVGALVAIGTLSSVHYANSWLAYWRPGLGRVLEGSPSEVNPMAPAAKCTPPRGTSHRTTKGSAREGEENLVRVAQANHGSLDQLCRDRAERDPASTGA
jgi:hypothetical protein